MTDTVKIFTKRLYEEWLPAFCNDPKRNHPTPGVQQGSITVSDFDARNFLRAIDAATPRALEDARNGG